MAEAIQYVLVTQFLDTKNAAIYYPNVYFINDSTELPELIPAVKAAGGSDVVVTSPSQIVP